MSFLATLFGGAAAEPIRAVMDGLDGLVTSDEEREKARLALEEIRQRPQILQALITQAEAQHRSVFVAGWRPFIGWVCGVGLAYVFLVNPVIQWFTGLPGPNLPTDVMGELVIALLGLGGLRTLEKVNGRTK